MFLWISLFGLLIFSGKTVAESELECQKGNILGDDDHKYFVFEKCSSKNAECTIKYSVYVNYLALEACSVVENATLINHRDLVLKKVIVGGNKDHVCMHTVNKNEETIFCRCNTNGCNQIGSALHKEIIEMSKEARGKELKYFTLPPKRTEATTESNQSTNNNKIIIWSIIIPVIIIIIIIVLVCLCINVLPNGQNE